MATVAAIQNNASGSLQDNLQAIEVQVQQASAQGAELILLPEHCLGQPKRILDLTESFGDGPGQAAMANMARRFGVWLVVGAMPIRMPHDGHVYSTSLVYDGRGECVAHYNKMHLCHVTLDTSRQVQESDRFRGGDQVVAIDTPVGRVGLSICYDVRFPELYRQLSRDQVSIFLVPAAFLAYTGQYHWQVLLRARAIENTCYVVAANQYGLLPNGHAMYGHTQIIDPWGEVMGCLEDGDGAVIAQLQDTHLSNVRDRLPALNHRRLQ